MSDRMMNIVMLIWLAISAYLALSSLRRAELLMAASKSCQFVARKAGQAGIAFETMAYATVQEDS